MHKRIALLMIMLFYSSMLFLTMANAEAASIFLLDASKPADGKITMTMSGQNIVDLYGYEARFSFDPDKLELLEDKSNLKGFSVSPIIKNKEIIIAHTKVGDVPGESGNVTIGTLTFKIKKDGKSTVRWDSIKVVNNNLKSTTYTVGKSIAVSRPMSKTFVDLAGHWAKEDVELLASMGIIEGMDDTHFMPDAMVTRAQFAAMITRALKLETVAFQSPFTDVSPDSWYAGVVSGSYSAGIVKGMTDNSFKPERPISREEMTVMLVRAGKYMSEETFKELGLSASIGFVDVHQISEWAIKEIETAVRVGIINGRDNKKFVPQGQATRAEAAVAVKRLLFELDEL
ncbi:S-layer homology domain-containing protein [Paenibacillus agaridevorans]|uniref:S-layer homology domain-containing protein n=1 Tax=Paenibacillus agaridevorans TaxID=171404 RepID=UPI001BE4C27B|nr:S-layer homology domain-containing protein [Paenibacillus agaridevorans]